MKTRKRKKKKK